MKTTQNQLKNTSKPLKKMSSSKRNLIFMQSLLDLIPMERINFHPIQVFQVLIQMTPKVSGKLSKIVPVAKFASHMCLILFLFMFLGQKIFEWPMSFT